ncbi:hypothetical protein NW754_000419 [Fusarium falciforme]|nr:hypothetical protein NW754_000419 [Fusarium falciforme]
MCAQRTSEWPGFCTWTKFQAEPAPIDEFIFDPLYTWSHSIRMPTYGRITESLQDYILSLGWNSPEAYQERPSRRCYEQPPVFGWVDEPETWNGDKALASVWLHDWKSEELEARFKRTEKRAVSMGRDIIYPLAIDDFEKRLRDLGALGWESVHVLFKDLNWIYDDEREPPEAATEAILPRKCLESLAD